LEYGPLINLGSYKFEIRKFAWSEVHPQKPQSSFALPLSALFVVNPFPVLPFAAIENRRPRGIRGIRGNGAGGKAGWSEPRKRTERQEKNRRKEAQNDTKRNLVFQFPWFFVAIPYPSSPPPRVRRGPRLPTAGLSSQLFFCDSLRLFVANLFSFVCFEYFVVDSALSSGPQASACSA
jgi:hypothetical protein